jgi:hypothetical protein
MRDLKDTDHATAQSRPGCSNSAGFGVSNQAILSFFKHSTNALSLRVRDAASNTTSKGKHMQIPNHGYEPEDRSQAHFESIQSTRGHHLHTPFRHCRHGIYMIAGIGCARKHKAGTSKIATINMFATVLGGWRLLVCPKHPINEPSAATISHSLEPTPTPFISYQHAFEGQTLRNRGLIGPDEMLQIDQTDLTRFRVPSLAPPN